MKTLLYILYLIKEASLAYLLQFRTCEPKPTDGRDGPSNFDFTSAIIFTIERSSRNLPDERRRFERNIDV